MYESAGLKGIEAGQRPQQENHFGNRFLNFASDKRASRCVPVIITDKNGLRYCMECLHKVGTKCGGTPQHV